MKDDSVPGEVPQLVDVDRLLADGVPELFRYMVRLTGGDRSMAEDLVQETCLALVRAVRSDPGTELSVGWLMVVGRRRFLDRIRSSRRESSRLEHVGATAETVEPDWSLVEGGVALECLGELPSVQRAALVLRYVDDLSTGEVAELLGRSVTATESLLARARRSLATAVEEVHHDDVGWTRC